MLALQVDTNTASYNVELVVTVSEAELERFRISAAMMDKPSVTPVTRPADVTVATSGFGEVHEIMTSATAKPVASRGTAWSWSVSPGARTDGSSVVISTVVTVSSGWTGSLHAVTWSIPEREQGNSQTVASALCHSILQRISPVYALHASISLEKLIPGSSGG